MSEALELAPSDAPVDAMPRADALAIYTDLRERFEKLKATAETLTEADGRTKEGKAIVRASRLSFKNLRVELERRRKELGEEALRRKQRIDGGAKEIMALIEPYEEKLLAIEQAEERAETARLAALKAERDAAIRAYGVEPTGDTSTMAEEAFDAVIDRLWQAKIEKQQADREAEAARVAKEKADADERARVTADNERLRREADEKEAERKKEQAARDKADAERREQQQMAMEEIQGIQQQAMIAVIGRRGVREGGTMQCLLDTLKETAEWPIGDHFGALTGAAQSAKDAAIAAINSEIKAFAARADAAEAKRVANEEARKAQAQRDADAAKEKARLAEIQKKADADKRALYELKAVQKAKADAEALALKAEQDARAAAERAPDREKLLTIAAKLKSDTLPSLTTKGARAILADIIGQLFTKAGLL